MSEPSTRKPSRKISKANKRQYIGGALSTIFSYAALAAVVNDPVSTFVTNAHWQQAPLHLIFVMTTLGAGMAAVAAYDRFRGKKQGQREQSSPGRRP